MSPKARPESEERILALIAMLSHASANLPVTRETIFEKLFVDELGSRPGSVTRVKAYEGKEDAVRQMFERDKKVIREMNFPIETAQTADGTEGYFIPREDLTVDIRFEPEEYDIVRVALSFCSFGDGGVAKVFSGSAQSASMLFAAAAQPLYAAIRRRRRVRFSYLSDGQPRVVDPLMLRIRNGATYLVARQPGTDELRLYRVDRIVGSPEILPDRFAVSKALMEEARVREPKPDRTDDPIKVRVRATPAVAGLVTARTPSAVAHPQADGSVELELTFYSVTDLRTFLVHNAKTVTLTEPGDVRARIRESLVGVNSGQVVPVDGLVFAPVDHGNSVALGIQILQKIVQSPEGMRISEVARDFNLDVDTAAVLLERLATMQPVVSNKMPGYWFPGHIRPAFADEYPDFEGDDVEGDLAMASAGDIDDDAEGFDTLYVVDAQQSSSGSDLSRLTVNDAIELNIALREATRILPDDFDLHSAIEKIEKEVGDAVLIDVDDERLEPQIHDAITRHQAIEIEYTKHWATEAERREVVPTDIKSLNGRPMFRAFCLTRNEWRVFRVDRVNQILATRDAPHVDPDPDPHHWLTAVGSTGTEVIVAMPTTLRFHFEVLPRVEWANLPDGRHAAKFRVSDDAWFDEQMVLAGEGAVVLWSADPNLMTAGRNLAREMADMLE